MDVWPSGKSSPGRFTFNGNACRPWWNCCSSSVGANLSSSSRICFHIFLPRLLSWITTEAWHNWSSLLPQHHLPVSPSICLNDPPGSAQNQRNNAVCNALWEGGVHPFIHPPIHPSLSLFTLLLGSWLRQSPSQLSQAGKLIQIEYAFFWRLTRLMSRVEK